MTPKERASLVDPDYPEISITRQAELLGIARSSVYYEPRVSDTDITAMHAIDEVYTKRPFYGSRRIRLELGDAYGIEICRDHVRRLMRLMGIEAIYPKNKRNTSAGDSTHKKYPYLLRDLVITHPNHVWGSDITYIRLETGWAYLVAILDWFSRYVISWELSDTLASDFCIATFERAFRQVTPDISNTDQGVQFTDTGFVTLLQDYKVKISMDGRGRCMDNIFTERLWRTVKYEDVYLKSYRDMSEARKGLVDYFQFYNTERPHSSLDDRTPEQVYLKQ